MCDIKSSPLIRYIQETCILLNDIDVVKDRNLKYFKVLYNKELTMQIIHIAKESRFSKSVFPLGYIDGCSFIYKTREPLVFINNRVVVEMWDQLCCKSLFQDAWLPLDKLIVENTWDNTEHNSGWRVLNQEFKMIYIITNSVFTKNGFSEDDSEYISANEHVFSSSSFVNMLEKEFFLFTPILIKLLKNGQYDIVVDELKKYKNY